jgi:hypothetical protein
MAKERERDLGRLGTFYFGIIAKDVKKEKREEIKMAFSRP